jgi:hypothetical protein
MELSREQLLRQQASGRVFQEQFDNALQPWGVRAAAPVLGEPVDEYRRRELIKAKKLLPDDHELRKIQVRQLNNDALDVLQPQILAACRDTAFRRDSVPEDAPLRRVESVDGNGLKIVDWIGQRSFVHDFTQPGRRARIRDPDRDRAWFLR